DLANVACRAVALNAVDVSSARQVAAGDRGGHRTACRVGDYVLAVRIRTCGLGDPYRIGIESSLDEEIGARKGRCGIAIVNLARCTDERNLQERGVVGTQQVAARSARNEIARIEGQLRARGCARGV